MEPKDLKNPDGLNRMKTPENLNDHADAEKEKLSDPESPVTDQLIAEEAEKETDVISDALSEAEPVEDEMQEKNTMASTVTENRDAVADPEPDVEVLSETTEAETVIGSEIKTEEQNLIQPEAEVSPESPEVTTVETEKTATEPPVAVIAETPGEEVQDTVSPVDADEEHPEETEEVTAAPAPSKEEAPGEMENGKKPAKKRVLVHVEKPEEVKKETEEVKETDYSGYSQIELVNAMRDILNNVSGEEDIKEEIDVIKAVFYKNLNENIEEQKKKFLDGGGFEEDFVPEEDPYENDIKELLKDYRNQRVEFNKKLEAEKEDNLRLKYEVIEEIKALINNEESINKTFQEFRDLQRRWREIGLVPQARMKDLWDTYHFHVENFYDYIKINKELRDLDLKKNLELKIELCEKAEELLVEPSILKAFNTLQKYHEQWREIGPVPIENKEDIWERFKAATGKINKKHQDFFENRKLEQKKNLDAKTALCEKVEEILAGELVSNKDWDDRSKELVQLQKVWRTIGFAPRKDNNRIYERFRAACDRFFDAKREFYSKNKELQQNNLQMKLDLCLEAEALKDSTDWKKTTQDFINIQKRWKEIGPVSRKHSDIIWKRFRAACDYFFEKKAMHFSGIDTEQIENLEQKEKLIEEVINFKPSDDVNENLQVLKSFQRRWTEIGHVPLKKKDEIQNRFREAINKLYDDLKLDEEKRNILNFRSKMSTYSESNKGQNKMRLEREKYMNKLKQLENDLVLLDNNIGFFAKSKNAESLIEDVKRKIENTREKIEFLKEKIRVIDEIDK